MLVIHSQEEFDKAIQSEYEVTVAPICTKLKINTNAHIYLNAIAPLDVSVYGESYVIANFEELDSTISFFENSSGTVDGLCTEVALFDTAKVILYSHFRTNCYDYSDVTAFRNQSDIVMHNYSSAFVNNSHYVTLYDEANADLRGFSYVNSYSKGEINVHDTSVLVSYNPLATVNAYEYSQVFAKDPKTVQNYSENPIHKTLDRL